MLKIISVAMLAVSVLAAPALAAGQGKTAQMPVIKAEQVNSKVLNAYAHMGRHHRHYRHHRHHRFHKYMGALKTHNFSKVSVKHINSAIKRS